MDILYPFHKLKNLRLKKKISLEELAKMTGYSIDFLTKLEGNELMAPVQVVLSIYQLLKGKTEEIETSLEHKKTLRKKKRDRGIAFDKRNLNYSYQVLTPQGRHNHLNVYKVTIPPRQDHQAVEYHHPGEEFIYVFAGALEVKVGRRLHQLETGDSLHFDCHKAHFLRSLSDEATVILVVIYTP